MRRILPIVEGDGDMQAVPALIRRVAAAQGAHDLVVSPAQKRGELPKVLGRFEQYLQAALLEQSPILWVMDYDCDACTNQTEHVAALQARAKGIARQTPVEFVFMVQEFESLFLADERSTRQVFPDIPKDLGFPVDPESVRDAKGWLSKARPKGLAYKPTQHQAKMASQVDIDRLRSCSPSFVRFESAVTALLADSSTIEHA
jgi:Domain of unknown function (DUF4276)